MHSWLQGKLFSDPEGSTDLSYDHFRVAPYRPSQALSLVAPDPTLFFIKDRGISEKRVRGFAKQGHLMKQTNSQEQGYSPGLGVMFPEVSSELIYTTR